MPFQSFHAMFFVWFKFNYIESKKPSLKHVFECSQFLQVNHFNPHQTSLKLHHRQAIAFSHPDFSLRVNVDGSNFSITAVQRSVVQELPFFAVEADQPHGIRKQFTCIRDGHPDFAVFGDAYGGNIVSGDA